MAIVRKRYLYLFGPFVRALRDSWGGRWGESGQRERETREFYSENEAKGERGPLVVTGLLCVSVEKKLHATREASVRIIGALGRRMHEASRNNW